MKIAIDMDNTLIDELGSTLRPGIIDFLDDLSKRHELILWTNSRRIRTMEILNFFDLRKYFTEIITRENYDPEEINLPKNLSLYDFDILIDDDIEEINFNKKKRKKAILISTYRKNKKVDENELKEIVRKNKL